MDRRGEVVEFGVLGPFEVLAAGGEVVSLGRAQQRAVLALLLIRTPQPVSRDRLIDEVWGERPPATAPHAVQVYVSAIRKLLRAGGGEAVVRSSPSGYVLMVDPERVDARRFERLVSQAQRVLTDNPARARAGFEEALGLWRGPPLPEFSQFEFARREADRLEELRAVALEGLVEARLALGEHSDVIATITGLVAANPLRENPRRLLMLALYRCGRHAEALAAYRDAGAALDELGLQPGPELRQLEEAILRHDASLRVSGAAEAAAGGGCGDGASARSVRGRSRELPVAGRVTMLFTEIEGSTRLIDRLGDRYLELLAEHDRLMRDAIEATGGYEVTTAGDSFFVAFADAGAGLDCAWHGQRLLAAARWPGGESVRVRMGIHTGAPSAKDGTYVGLDVHCAALVMAAAHGGQVLLTEAAVDALGPTVEVRDVGHHRLKDLPAPVHLFQPVSVDLPAEFPPLRTLSNSNLPAPLHDLIGRSLEVATALQMLERGDVRLVTMLGPGGTGKTRLALEVAAEAVTRYRDGAWFVSLAPIVDASLITSEIAQALGVREPDGRPLEITLGEALSRRELLLVLDNFEHLVQGAGLISRLLEAAPGLSVLVTSREALHLRAEHRLEVAPLPLEDAAELFLERARAVRAEACTEPRDREAVDRICLRLDGLPLALELAAARVVLFGVRALEARLAERLDVVEGPRDLPDRQRTLRATMDWSYQLLSPAEQAMFHSMATFNGGARIEAIEHVVDDPALDPTAALAALLNKSLLRRRDDTDGQPRFWMLETIRQFAWERATEEGDSTGLAAKHAVYFLTYAEEAERHFYTGAQASWLEYLEADHDNLRAAFDYFIASAPSQALRIAAALGDFWEIHGHLSEGQERVLRGLSCAPVEGATASKASFFAGRFAFLQGNVSGAEVLFAQALSAARQAGDTRVQVMALTHEGMVAQALGEPERSIELNEQALAIARAGTDDRILGVALNNLGDTLSTLGERTRARLLLEEALDVSRRLAEPMGTIIATINLGDLALASGDLAAADSLIAEAIRDSEQIDFRAALGAALALNALLELQRGRLETAAACITKSVDYIRDAYNVMLAANVLAAAAALAAAQRDALRAAQLWGASDNAMLTLGITDGGSATHLRDQWLPQVRESADAAAWQAAWESGARLPPHEALAIAAASKP